MTKPTHRYEDVKDLIKCLESLDIVVSADKDGFTVFSKSEPLFCFTRSTHDEIKEVVIDTIKSYVETFYHIEDAVVGAVEEPIKKEVVAVPRYRLKPVSKLRPEFGGPTRERRFSFA